MNFLPTSTRALPILLLFNLIILVGCKTAPDTTKSTAPKDGYEYTVQNGDTYESIAKAYGTVGLEVTAKQILTENPNVKSTTVFINGLRCHAPEVGVKLFIPGDVKQKEEARTIAPSLNEPIEFDGYTVSQFSSQAEAKRLMTQKLKSSGTYYTVSQDANGKEIMTPHDGFDFFRYPDGRVVRTETVEQFIQACEHDRANGPDDKNKAYSATTADIEAEMAMGNIKDQLEFMTKVQPSIRSYLTGKYLQYLPVDVLMSSLNACDGETSDKYDKILKRDVEKGKTLKNYTQFFAPLHLTKVKEEGKTLSFYDATMEIDYYIKEIGRGDVDGDGNEDALIEIGWHTQGTMGGSYTSVVTRTGPDQKVKWVTTDKFVQCSPHTVKLVGVIKNQTFPGPPNYESVAKGDEPEDYWILTLDKPIDVAEDPDYPVPDENRPQLNQRELQIDLGGDYTTYAKLLGKKVEVTDSLSQGFTVHHKTPVMIGAREIRAVE